MKELSIEEKAKRYDVAIIRGSRLWESDMITRENYEYIFPEVKESEGERIRKALIEMVHDTTGDELWIDYNVHKEEALAWLEKQDNLMKALQISNAEIGELIEKNYYLKEQLEKQGKNNMGISEATKKKLEDNLNKALEKETPESCNEFLEKQSSKEENLKERNICDTCEDSNGCLIPCCAKLLEKQGEQKPVFEMKTPEESLGIDSETYSKIVDECVYGEQKPIKEHNACEFCEDRHGCVNHCSMKLVEEEKYTDNVEPKFHKEEWITNGDYIWQIVNVTDLDYILQSQNGHIVYDTISHVDEHFHLWTIQDAKAGDVLAVTMYPEGTWIGILKEHNGCTFSSYCFVNTEGTFKLGTYNHGNGKAIHPATKEQRNTLLKAMADAGYTFDFEKKELKKVEQKPAWSEEDIELLDNTIKFIEDRVAATSPSLRTYSPTLTGKEIPFLKALKDRVQPKQEWSEEDNRMCKAIIDNIQAICEEGYFVGNIDSGELIEWLKSLRPQSQWKPSDEQMDALRYVTNFDYGGYKATLVSLYEQLKKLRG